MSNGQQLIMTGRAVRRRPDPLPANALQITLYEICRLRIAHRRDLVNWTQIQLRLTMAIKTPAHTQRLCLNGRIHLIDTPMACLAAHATINVNGVTELHIVRKLVNIHPGNRLTSGPAIPHGEQPNVFRQNLVMTVHASLRRRNDSLSRHFDTTMTVPTIHAELPNVKLVTVRNRLHRMIPHVGILRREVIPDKQDGEHTANKRSDKTQRRQQISLLRKYLWHSNKPQDEKKSQQ